MQRFSPKGSNGYLAAVALTAVALGLRALVDPWAGDHYPVITLFAAIAGAALVGGSGPGLVAATLGYLGANWLFVPVRYTFSLPNVQDWVGFGAYVFTAGLLIALAAIARRALDTARRERDQFAEQHELLTVTLRSIGDGVITTDADGRVTAVNHVAEQLTGWPSADARGQPLETVFNIVNERTRQPAPNPVQRALAEGRVVGLANHTVLVARDGRETPIDDSAAPIRHADGRIGGAVLVFRNVADHQAARLALEAADRQKDEFLGVLAHELRNPLSPISNAVQVLKAGGEASPRSTWAADLIGRQVKQLSALLDDLLDTARIAQRKLRLDLRRVPLEPSLREAIEVHEPQFAVRRQRLVVALELDDAQVTGDPVRLVQVFSNLLNNANKYTPEGGTITVTARHAEGHAAVTVSDDGIGIAAEYLPRIFLMYSQAHAPTPGGRGQGTGLGIGLALSRMLVEMHGGRLTAASEGPGRGSRFTVVLPLADAAATPQPAPAPAASHDAGTAPARTLTVIVVEDQPDLRESLAALLAVGGHAVRAYDTAAAALAECGDVRPDVAILDLGLPDLSVSAGVILTHSVEVKLTHLGEDGGFARAVDVDPGASSGDTSEGP